MKTLPLRLRPGDDLRGALESAARTPGWSAAFVLCGIGSLSATRLQLAGAGQALVLDGEVEILTLSGSVCADGAHLHMSVADAQGRVLGGHVAPGCVVRTTVELLLARASGWSLSREPDPATGWTELVVRRPGR